jgi:predicted ribosomally synthesized peptide with SipW-like signal peptide
MKKSASKKTLIASAAAVGISALLLAGTSYAWFTDSASSAISTVKSGKLDVNLYKMSKVADESEDAEEGAMVPVYNAVSASDIIFANNTVWEPGAVEVQYLKVANEGTLALKYNLTIPVISKVLGRSENGWRDDIDLTKILKVAVVELDEEGQEFASRADAIKAAQSDDAVEIALDSTTASYTGHLSAKSADSTDDNSAKYIAIVVYMPETVGNEANYSTANIPTVTLGVNLAAGQYSEEEDSFGSDYDENAVTPTMVQSYSSMISALKNAKAGDVVSVTKDVTYNGTGNTAVIEIPEGVTLHINENVKVKGVQYIRFTGSGTLDNYYGDAQLVFGS